MEIEKEHGNGIVYKIGHKNNKGKYYIGVTNRLDPENRFRHHVTDYKLFKKNRPHKHFLSVFEIFDKYKPENTKVTVLKKLPTDKATFVKENEYIIKGKKSCINRQLGAKISKSSLSKIRKT